jgi:hypothetical protein
MKKILFFVITLAIFTNLAFAGFYQDKINKESTQKFNKQTIKATEFGRTKIRCLAVCELTDIKSGSTVDFEAIGRLDDEMLVGMRLYNVAGFFVNDYTGKTE